MMKVIVEEFKAALKKLNGFKDSTIVLDFTTRDAGSGKRYLKLTACNGVAQAVIMTVYVGGEEEAKTYIVGSQFTEICDSIGAFGDEYIFEESGNVLKLSCGSAVVPVELVKDALTIKMVAFNKVDHWQVSVASKGFSELVTRGGFSAADGNNPIFNNTIVFYPTAVKDTRMLNVLSCSGAMISGANVDISVKNDDVFLKKTEEVATVTVKLSGVAALAKRFCNESIEFIATDKQLVIVDGVDIYFFQTVEGKVPKNLIDLVSMPQKKKFCYNVDLAVLKKALAVATVTGDPLVCFSFEKEELRVSDTKRGNAVTIPITAVAETDKEEIINSAVFIKKIVDSMPSEVSVSCPETPGMFFEGERCRTFLLPVKAN